MTEKSVTERSQIVAAVTERLVEEITANHQDLDRLLREAASTEAESTEEERTEHQ
jgi:hypothetical protein